MSSQIPVRRSTRTTKPPATDNENANARPFRNTLVRTKAVANATEGSNNRLHATTASSRAKMTSDIPTEKLPGKRKREALSEVTEVNREKTRKTTLSKGKEKETDVKLAKARQPLRTVSAATSSQISRPQHKKSSSSASAIKVYEDAQPVVKPSGPRRPLARIVEDELPTIARVAPVQNHRSTASASITLRPRVTLRPRSTITQDSDLLPIDQKRKSRSKDAFPGSTREAEPVPTPDVQDQNQNLLEEEEKVAVHLVAAEEGEAEAPHYDDLGYDDSDDPTMVSEYLEEILEYLKEVEKKTLPDADYMSTHLELTWNIREMLVDWLMDAHARYKFTDETLHLCINLLDRFLSRNRNIGIKRFQLVGLACFLIACKFEESLAPSITELAHYAGGVCEADDICKAERYILSVLGWDLSHPGPMTWLRRGSRADGYDIRCRIGAKYLIEVAYLDWRLMGLPPSRIAATALYLSRLIHDKDHWDHDMERYTCYAEEDLVEPAGYMLNYISKVTRLNAVHKKYAAKSKGKISNMFRQWVVSLWGKNANIDLRNDLPALRAWIIQRKLKKAMGETSDAEA